jgi:hypothetical protein
MEVNQEKWWVELLKKICETKIAGYEMYEVSLGMNIASVHGHKNS